MDYASAAGHFAIEGVNINTTGPAPTGGTITKITITSGAMSTVIQDLAVPFNQVVSSSAVLSIQALFAGNDTLSGSIGSDYLDGWLGSNTLNGGGGNDTFEVSAGINRLDGGAGVDTALYERTGVQQARASRPTSIPASWSGATAAPTLWPRSRT